MIFFIICSRQKNSYDKKNHMIKKITKRKSKNLSKFITNSKKKQKLAIKILICKLKKKKCNACCQIYQQGI